MHNIAFSIDLPDIGLNNDDLSSICKHLMLQWYDETYKDKVNMSNLENKINNGVKPLISEIKQLYGGTKSIVKGQIFENIIEKTLKDNFPHYNYDNTAKNNHCGDGLLMSPSGMTAIIEMKNYSTTVNSSQINKLKYDMQNTGIKNALLLSAYTGIQGKKLIDIETFVHQNDKYNIVHISKYMENEQSIQIGITILESLYGKKDIDYIEHELHNLEQIINSMSSLKSQYLTMEKSMRENLDSFYVSLRDTEYNMKKQISSILKGIKENDVVYNSDNSLLMYMYDTILKDNGYEIHNDLCLYKNGLKHAIIKLVAKRVDITFIDPEIKLSITQNNKTISERLLLSIVQLSQTKKNH